MTTIWQSYMQKRCLAHIKASRLVLDFNHERQEGRLIVLLMHAILHGRLSIKRI